MLKDGCITEEALETLSAYADLIECECPNHLMDILAKVREFRAYTTSCIEKYPQDEKTHRWLQSASRNVDALLSTTIVQLARIEGFIDGENKFVARAQVKRQSAG